MIHTGDCVEVMAAMDPDSIDAIVTDPPYGLEFMGKEWDRLRNRWEAEPGRYHNDTNFLARGDRVRYEAGPKAQEWHQRWATEALRVAKPGAYLLAFGGTRTVHRLTVALEDAGWIIRDLLVWAYASGFPKSKASLKPAWEPIVLARKPGPLQELAIDACRIPGGERPLIESRSEPSVNALGDGLNGSRSAGTTQAARWPANILLTDPIFDGDTEGVVGGGESIRNGSSSLGRPGVFARDDKGMAGYTDGDWGTGPRDVFGYGDTGTYSRFFLIPKASRSDREPVVPGDLEEGMPDNAIDRASQRSGDGTSSGRGSRSGPRLNVHPTVKPTDLMRHLVRLVTPQGGTVLDPFLGSGSTALAAEGEGFAWVGIEREAEYVTIAEQRLVDAQRGLGL